MKPATFFPSLIALAALMALTFASAPRAAGAPLTIKNDRLQVTVDPAAGRFTLTALPSGKVFVKDGRLRAASGTGKIEQLDGDHIVLPGKRQLISVYYPATREYDCIELYPDLPFALFRAVVNNGDDDALVKNRITTLQAPLDLGLPLNRLSILGTGGLGRVENGELKFNNGQPPRKPSNKKTSTKPSKKDAAKSSSAPKPLETPKPTFSVPPTPEGDELGSYLWMAVADPATRAGVVGAWLTQNRASGVIFPRLDAAQTLSLEAQLHYGRLQIPPRTALTLETFVLGYFDDARLGLEAWADLVAKVHHIKLPPQPVGHCTWYMEKNRGACDEQHFAELSRYAAEHLKPFGFNFVQIDDGWQAGLKKNGPKKNFNEIDPRGGYPSGMKATADTVKSLGFIPGIWFMPFAGNYEDPFFADKQDLFVKTEDGKPYETSWGGTCLDMTNPKTQAYLARMVHRISQDWGYTFFKMDGMWTGTGTAQVYVNNGFREDGMGDAVFHDPAMTNIEAYRAGIRTVRKAAGPDAFLLGCCVSQNMRSLCGALGLVDAFRIGPDTGSGHIGSPHATRNYFIHGRIWYNDPDCVSVRTSHPLGNARANATFTAISGNLFYNSDWIPDLPAERLDILKRTMLPHGLLEARPVDLFEQPVARIWLLTDSRRQPRRDVVALFNWDRENPATIEAPLAHIGLDPSKPYAAFDFWDNKLVAPLKDKLSFTVPPDSCVVLAVRPAADVPQLLSTSFHVTQGMVDVTEEKWNADTKTLSGKSRLVAGDPYELRIALPEGFKALPPVASADRATARLDVAAPRTEPGLARVTLTASESCTASWSVRFQ